MAGLIFKRSDDECDREVIWTATVRNYSAYPRDCLISFEFRNGGSIDVKFLDEKSLDECLIYLAKNFRKGICEIFEVMVKEIL